MIKIFLNCGTIHKGGALQVALSTLKAIISDRSESINWFFLISESIANQIELPVEKTFILKKSPSKSFKARKEIKKIVEMVSVDGVFTLFGPAYVKFDLYHLCGVADSWVTNENFKLYRYLYKNLDGINRYLLSLYKKLWYKKADHWVVESDSVKKGLSVVAHINESMIDVVPNTVSDYFSVFLNNKKMKDIPESFNILFLASNYPHKNFKILPQVIEELAKADCRNFIFTLTLDAQCEEWLELNHRLEILSMSHHVCNLGKISLCDLTSVYESSHILFFPTLIEAFSATPLEALYMNLPIVLSNIGANKDIVKEYGVYFDPYVPTDAAKALAEVMQNYDKAAFRALEAKKNLLGSENLFSNHDRFLAYKKIILSGVENYRKNSLS